MICKRILILLAMLQAAIGHAQQFDPFNGQAEQYHADMRLFFKDANAESATRQMLLNRVHQFKQQSNWTIQNLRIRLNSYENLTRNLQLHYQYFRLMAERNRKDTAARRVRDEMAQQIDVCAAQMDSVLQQPAFLHFTPIAIKSQGLTAYTYLFSQEKEQARHTLSPAAEQMSSALSTQMLDNLTNRYDDLVDTIKPGKTRAASLQAFAKHGELFAATLIDITRTKQSIATAHHYRNAPEQYYQQRLQLSEDSVKAVFAKIAAQTEVLKNYQQLQQQLVRKATRRDTVHSWDVGFANAYAWQPLYFNQVQELVNSALAPLGKLYQEHFSRLLNPQNGLLDIAYSDGRAGGGNSFGTTGTPIGLFMQRFDGGFRNTSTLIHEGGHAIHRQLMAEHGTTSFYTSGPNFLSEAYAMLNELLLLDELQNRAKNKAEKAYYTSLFTDKLAHEIFTSAEEGTFEQELYTGVAAGRINGFKDINQCYAGVMKTYDVFFPTEPGRETEWITKRLVFEDPLYNANYLFAILLTCKLYQMHLQHPEEFAARYNALLSNGYSAPAAISIKKYMGFELNYSDLLTDALQLMRTKTAELKQLTE